MNTMHIPGVSSKNSTTFGKLGLFPWDRGDWKFFEYTRVKSHCFFSWVDPLRVIYLKFPGLWEDWIGSKELMAQGLKDGDSFLREVFIEEHGILPENLNFLMRWLARQGWRRPAYVPEVVSGFSGQGAWNVDAASLLIWFDSLGIEYCVPPPGFSPVAALGIRALTSAFTGDVRQHWSAARAGGAVERVMTGVNTLQFLSWWTGVSPEDIARHFNVPVDNFWNALWHRQVPGKHKVGFSPRYTAWEHQPMTNWSSFAHLKGNTVRKIAEDGVLLGIVKLWLIDSATDDPEIRADLTKHLRTMSRADLWASALGLGVPERLPLMRLLGPPFVNACSESSFQGGFPRIKK